MENDDEWLVYCIKFKPQAQRTYVGATNDFTRRLRQHNGQLKGGAKYTTAAVKRSRSPSRHTFWQPIFVVRGFPDRRSALQFEWALKDQTMHHRSVRDLVERRRTALAHLMCKDRATSKSPLLASLPLRVEHYS